MGPVDGEDGLPINLGSPSTVTLSGSASWGNFNSIEFGGQHINYRTLEDSESDASQPILGFSAGSPEVGSLSFHHPVPRNEKPDHTVEVIDPYARGGHSYITLELVHAAVEQMNPEAYAEFLAAEGVQDLPGESTAFYAESGTITSRLDSNGYVAVSFDVLMKPVLGEMGPEIRLVGTGRGPMSISCANWSGNAVGLAESGGWITTPHWELDPHLRSAYCQSFADWL